MSLQSIAAMVMGGSAGALEALGVILPALPASFGLPVAIVLHVPRGRNRLIEVIAHQCVLPVAEAEDKAPLAPGVVYVAPPNYHLLIERRRCLSLSTEDPVRYSRPSIDVLFETAADAYGPALVGVLLTGANDDGARGLARIRSAGGVTVVQSPETATSRMMPEAALRLTSAHHVLPLSEIGPFLARLGARAMANKETV